MYSHQYKGDALALSRSQNEPRGLDRESEQGLAVGLEASDCLQL